MTTRKELFALAQSEALLDKEAAAAPDDPDLPFGILRRAIEEACAAQLPVLMAKFTVLYQARLQRQLSDSPLKALCRSDLPPDALQRIWSVADMLEPPLRAYALLLTAWKLKSLGRLGEAGATLNRLNARLPEAGIELERAATLLIRLLGPEFDMSPAAAALVDRNDNLQRLALDLAGRGHFESARRIAVRAQCSSVSVSTLCEIAELESRAGQDMSETLSAALEREPDGYFLALIAGLLAEAGRLDEAMDAAKRVGNSPNDSEQLYRVLEEIVAGLCKIGQLGVAKRMAALIEEPEERAKALAHITAAQVAAGEAADDAIAAVLTAADKIVLELDKDPAGEDEWEEEPDGEGDIDDDEDDDDDDDDGDGDAEEEDDDLLDGLDEESMLMYSRAQPVEEVVRALIAAGRFGDARKLSARVEHTESRAGMLSQIARGEALAQQDPGESFEAALALARSLEGHSRTEALRQVAWHLAETGRAAQAIATAEEIKDKEYRRWTLRDVARFLAERGEPSASAFELAISAAKKASEDGELKEIAADQARAGMFAEAMSTAGSIREKTERAEALKEIALARAKAGLDSSAAFSEALAVLDKCTDPFDRLLSLPDIVEAQVEAGQDAVATFLEFLPSEPKEEDDPAFVECLCRVAVVQAEGGGNFAGTLDRAHAAARDFRDPDRRDRALVEVAKALMAVGLLADAETAARKIKDFEKRLTLLLQIGNSEAATPSDRSRLLVAVHDEALKSRKAGYAGRLLAETAAFQARADRYDEAAEILARISGSTDYAAALHAVVAALVEKRKDCTELLAQAAQDAAKMKGSRERSRMWRAIASAQKKAAHDVTAALEQAVAAARASRNPDERVRELLETAIAQAEVGADSTETFALAESVKLPESEPVLSFLPKIAEAQARAGRFDEALETAERIEDNDGCRFYVLLNIAQSMLKAGRDCLPVLDRAREIVLPEEYLSSGLESLARVQALAGNVSDAVKTASALGDPGIRAQALVSIARIVAESGGDPEPLTVQARSEAEKTDDLYRRSDALSGAAYLQIGAGRPDEALVTLDLCPESESYPWMLDQIGSALAGLSDRTMARSLLVSYLPRAARIAQCTWHACGVIAQLYPESADELADFLIDWWPGSAGKVMPR